MIGRLRALGGDDANAVTAFNAAVTGDAAGASGCAALLDYARARAAAAYERMGKPEDAIVSASGVGSRVAIADEAALVRAEACAAKGDRARRCRSGAIILSKHPRGFRWVDTSVRLANALLDNVDGDAKGHAREIHDLVTHVAIEAPTLDESSGAAAARKRAEALDASLPHELAMDERIKRAKALVDASQPDKARVEIDAAIAAIPQKDRAASEIACRAEAVRAQAIAKSKKGSSADAWGEAIRACAKESDALASALYNGAKASASAQRPDEAIDRYGRIEKEFSKHRLADDARLASALIVHDRDAAKFETMLTRVARRLPRRRHARRGDVSRRARAHGSRRLGGRQGAARSGHPDRRGEPSLGDGGAVGVLPREVLGEDGRRSGREAALGRDRAHAPARVSTWRRLTTGSPRPIPRSRARRSTRRTPRRRKGRSSRTSTPRCNRPSSRAPSRCSRSARSTTRARR